MLKWFQTVESFNWKCCTHLATSFNIVLLSRYCYCVTCIYVTRIYDIICNSEFPDELVVRVRA